MDIKAHLRAVAALIIFMIICTAVSAAVILIPFVVATIAVGVVGGCVVMIYITLYQSFKKDV